MQRFLNPLISLGPPVASSEKKCCLELPRGNSQYHPPGSTLAGGSAEEEGQEEKAPEIQYGSAAYRCREIFSCRRQLDRVSKNSTDER